MALLAEERRKKRDGGGGGGDNNGERSSTESDDGGDGLKTLDLDDILVEVYVSSFSSSDDIGDDIVAAIFTEMNKA